MRLSITTFLYFYVCLSHQTIFTDSCFFGIFGYSVFCFSIYYRFDVVRYNSKLATYPRSKQVKSADLHIVPYRRNSQNKCLKQEKTTQCNRYQPNNRWGLRISCIQHV